ncbi:MAG TPA: ABC transporter ATP-binding protein [Balneolales bacterium]|nr:ABC transporter ATP-binding protein [Balneolales bacterium]
MLELKDIYLKFGNEVVLNKFNLTIEEHEKIVIKGTSGIGKSTIINLILGFIKPDSGEIFWNGIPVTENNIHVIRSSVAWLPQDFMFGSGSVEDVIQFPFQFKRNNDLSHADEDIIGILHALNLDKTILSKKFTDISEGQKQRIGLALCLLLNRNFILLDEPTSALDAETKQKVIKLFLENKDLTVLTTSHDPEWVKKCDRIIELNK